MYVCLYVCIEEKFKSLGIFMSLYFWFHVTVFCCTNLNSFSYNDIFNYHWLLIKINTCSILRKYFNYVVYYSHSNRGFSDLSHECFHNFNICMTFGFGVPNTTKLSILYAAPWDIAILICMTKELVYLYTK